MICLVQATKSSSSVAGKEFVPKCSLPYIQMKAAVWCTASPVLYPSVSLSDHKGSPAKLHRSEWNPRTLLRQSSLRFRASQSLQPFSMIPKTQAVWFVERLRHVKTSPIQIISLCSPVSAISKSCGHIFLNETFSLQNSSFVKSPVGQSPWKMWQWPAFASRRKWKW